MEKVNVFAGAKPGDWIVLDGARNHMVQIHTVTTTGMVLVGQYGKFGSDGWGHLGRVQYRGRLATPDEVAAHLEREAERKRKWDAEQAEERRVEAIRNAAPDLLASLKEILPHAEREIKRLNDTMVGSLYPAINTAMIQRAKDVIARAEPQES
jgi:hypothetical protein